MTAYLDYLMEHVRLAVLRWLQERPAHAGNDSLLATAMGELGLPITRDQLRAQIAWLEEQGLVRVQRPRESVLVVSLRERGAEVALGLAHVDGVQRPSVAR